MNNTKSIQVIGGLILLGSMSCSYAQQMYAGLDIGHNLNGFQKGYGKEVFASKSPFIDVQFGKMFKDNWGIEFGIAHTHNKKQKSDIIGTTDSLPGLAVTPRFNHATISESQRKNAYIALIGLYPLNKSISFFGAVGLSGTWMRNEYKPVIFDDISLISSQQTTLTKTFKTHGKTLILKAGAKYRITEGFGIKVSYSWENTGKLKSKSSQSPHLDDLVKHKNTSKIGIGFYINS